MFFKNIQHFFKVIFKFLQDIFIYYQNNCNYLCSYPLPDQHPLNNLIKNDDQNISIKNSLRHLPYKELMSISNKIAEETSKPKHAL